MFKKLLFSTLFLSLLFFASFSTSFAQSCGDWYTVGSCYVEGGCNAGSMCKADGPWPWHWNYRCEVDQQCIQPPPPPVNTTANCGIERTVNGRAGCFADDNAIIENGVNCQSGGNLCCRQSSMCPAATDEPTGCGILTNGGSTCRLQGQDIGNFNRCGQTQACCSDGVTCPQLPQLQCGNQTEFSDQGCSCETGLRSMPNGEYCCGWVDGSACKMTDPAIIGGEDPDPENPDPENPDPNQPTDPVPTVDIFEGPTSANFKQLNPLEMFGNAEGKALTSPGAIISRLLLFAFPLAGLILFVMIVWGGFEMLTGATSKGIEAGKQRVTAAIVGFTLLFVAFWIFQIVEVIFGVAIL